MGKRTATLSRVLAIGAMSITLVSTALAIDQAPAVVPVANRAPAEVSENGIAPEVFFDQQRQLNAWLVTQLPAGAESATVRVELTDQDRQDLATPVAAAGQPMPTRVGIVKPMPDRVGLARGQSLSRQAKNENSAWESTEDGGFVWATTIVSPDAVAVRVRFQDFSIPAKAEVYFFSPEGEAYGPYVGAGPDDTGEFWSNSLTSSTGTVLLKYYGAPDPDALAGLSLRITEVGHVATDFPRPAGDGGVASFCTYNASCVQNNSCVNEPAVNDAEKAVAKMRWIAGQYIYICSGGLLADTDAGSQIPYFLTANHCISSSSVAANLECYFQYSVSCGTSTCVASFSPAPSPSTLGATVKATGTAGDYTLLQLNQTPPSGSIFLGWNNAPIANTNGADLHRVSHPSGAPQAYSHHQVDTGAVTCQGWPRGQRIYSNDVYGATEGGSSGSPVVNAAGEVVGQLSGCCGYNCGNECDTASNSTVDGAFAYYWGNVAQYLDPSPCVPSTENCTNGVDDDCDGFVDCLDSDCASDPACQSSCGAKNDPCSTNSDCCSNRCNRRKGLCR